MSISENPFRSPAIPRRRPRFPIHRPPRQTSTASASRPASITTPRTSSIPQKAQDFYAKVLGGDYPPLEAYQCSPDHAQRLVPTGDDQQQPAHRAGSISPSNKGKTPPPIKFQDINANYAGFQVSNIETAYARAKENGAITVSEGGIIDFHNGRAALIRDSDVGGYIMLWQPASQGPATLAPLTGPRRWCRCNAIFVRESGQQR